MDAMDASPGMLEKAKEKGLYDRYIVGILGENTLDTLTGGFEYRNVFSGFVQIKKSPVKRYCFFYFYQFCFIRLNSGND